LFARLLAGLALAAVMVIATPGVSAETTVNADVSLVTAAIIDAVRQRLAPATVVVTVDSITDLRLAADVRSVTAHVSPYARIGEPARFVLTAPGGTRGEATAVIQVMAEGVRARTMVRRGAQIAAGDVESLQVSLARRPIRPVPQLVDVTGAKALRDLEPGVVVAKADVAPMPLVRAGRGVAAHVTIGDARVTGSLVAVQNGARNQIIRVINPETRETRRARVVGVDEVEVVHGR
jgi:flagella basal body P-ring formation protein FlgA